MSLLGGGREREGGREGGREREGERDGGREGEGEREREGGSTLLNGL